jgi:hypothetical protein
MAEDKNHRYGSFDYKIINPLIKAVLDNRSRLDNTVQVAMPFVKATTTLQHEFLGEESNIGFTLGLHGINKDVTHEEMYAGIDPSAPLIGYTYRLDGTPHLVYAVNPELDQISTRVDQIFDKQASIVTYPNNSNFTRIPPPGITNMTIGRNKNGLLASAQLDITIPSLIQLECLHRTFLVPGLGMVVEWGQQFAVESLTTNVTGELPDISYNLFPWANRPELLRMLDKLARREVGLQDIMDKYVYPTSGQYMWMFGRVANFSVQSNSDGSFKANVKIVGPSEDAWAYSTTTTVVPKKDASAPYFCASDVNSVQSYFTNTVAGGLNLKTLLDDVRSGKRLKDWEKHILYFKQGNQAQEGEPKPNSPTATTEQQSFGDSEDAYFMTWKFFVNVVINDDTHGIKAILRRAGISPDKLATIGLLLPYASGPLRQNSNVAGIPYVDDPKESFVGANPYLRSIDPSTLIIVNPTAAKLAEKNPQYNIPSMEEKLLEVNEDSNNFSKLGWFDKSATKYLTGDKLDRGFLSCGVWVNHKAVVEAMAGADTIMRGISTLLERMNSATRGYWQLTLDQIEGDDQLPNPHSYIVVDANWRDSSENAVAKFIDNVHIFNKYVRKSTSDGTLVGSDLIECSVDLSLPKRLFSQIATLGLVSSTDVAAAGGGNPEETGSIKISDPNDTLAKMFGITSLSVKNGNGRGPDLTILPNEDRAIGVCGKSNTQTTAGTAGQGSQAGGIDLNTAPKTEQELQKLYSRSLDEVKSEVCKQCEKCVGTTTAPAIQTPTTLIPVIPSNPVTSTSVAPPGIAGGPAPVAPPTNRENITRSTVSYKAKNGQTITVQIEYDDKGSNAISKALYNAGYRNGRIPSEYLKVVNGKHRLYPEVADAFIEMQNKYKADTGNIFTVNEGYRSLQTQIDYIPQKGLYNKSAPVDSANSTGKAGVPGKSNHGFGLAVDISTRGLEYASPEYKWLEKNAGAFGFTNIEGEAWHWEYTTRQLKSAPRPIGTQSTQIPSSPTTRRTPEPGHSETGNLPRETSNSDVCKKLSELTIQEITSVQKPNGKVLAVGKYQAIPVTFNAWLAAEKIPSDTVFDTRTQERLGDWLIVGKRPKVGKYINGTGNVTIEEAQLQLAKEFASIPVPFDLTNDKGTFIKAGESYYKDRGGNKAQHSVEEVRAALNQARNSKSLTSLKQFIAKGEGGYDSLNTGVGGDTATYSEKYFRVLDSCEKTRPALPTPEPIPPTQSPPRDEVTPPPDQFCIDNQKKCDACKKAKDVIRQLNEINAVTAEAKAALRQFYNLRKIFRYIEVYPDLMVASIADTANGNDSNAFGAAPGALSIAGDLVMPGINGIRVGELFWIDRIPAFYKAFGAFQVMSVEDTIGTDGWKTKIHARFNYLGTKWKTAMYKRLQGAVQ